MATWTQKLISTVLSAALIVLSPGLPAYNAFAADTVGKGGGHQGFIPSLPTPTIGSGQSINLPDVSLTNLTISPSGLGAPIPGSEAAVSIPGAQNVVPGITAVPSNAASHPTGQSVQPGRLNAASPNDKNATGAQNDGSAGKIEPVVPIENTATPTPENAETRTTAQNELSAALKDEKTDKPGALNWLFDRFKRRKSDVAPAVVAGVESTLSNGLTKADSSAAKQQASVPAPNAPEKPKSRWERFKARFSLSEFNSSEKAYLGAEAVFYLALTVYLASLPILVKGITGDAADTGVARMIHYWTMSGAALFAGEIVSRTPMKRVLKLSAMTRAMIFGTIGITALAGVLGGVAGWPLFLGLVGMNALIISMHSLVNLKSGGAARVFDSKAKIEKAGYLYSTIASALMLVIPPLLGWGIDKVGKAHGPLIGAGMGYVIVGALMGAVAYLYTKVKPLPKKAVDSGEAKEATPIFQAAKTWLKELLSTRHGRYGSASLGLGAGLLLAVPFLGVPAMVASIIMMAGGVMVALNWDAMKAVASNKLILGRSGMATFEAFIDDALFAVVMPSFAVDILMAGALGNGLLLSAITAGGLVASSFMLRKSQLMEKKLGSYRWLATLTLIAALGFLPSIVLWVGLPAFLASPLGAAAAWLSTSTGAAISVGLLVAIPAVFLMKLAVVPLQSRMGTLLQTTIDEDPKASKQSDKIWSLMGFFEMMAAGAGGLLFSWLYKHSGPGSAVGEAIGANAPMKIVTAALVVTGIIYFLGLRLMKGQLTRSTFKSFPNTQEEAALAKLANNLKRMGLPPVTTRVQEEPVDPNRPTVAYIAPASPYKLAMAQEGARQSEGNFFLALDPSWVDQEIMANGKTREWLKKGLTFENGKPVIVEFKTPRRLGYSANFYTMGSNGRDDGVPFETNLETPQSSSVHLEKDTNDKLYTRIMLAALGIAVPATAAFLMPAHPLQGVSSPSAMIQIQSMSDERAAIRSSIEQFLKHYDGPEVVVKPSGPSFHSSIGVEFFDRNNVDGMVEHAMALSKHELMTADGAVLVDERLAPPALYIRTKGDVTGDGAITGVFSVPEGDGRTPMRLLSKDELATAGKLERKDWNIRVLAARAPWGGGVTTGMFVRAGAWGDATVAEAKDPEKNAAIIRIEDAIEALRRQHGLLATPQEEAQFIADLNKMGADAINAIAAREATRQRKPGEALQSRTDYIGLDVMVVVENGRLVPKIIEVNDHDAGGQWQLDMFYPDNQGEHSRAWIATGLESARLENLRGKRIAIIGAGYEGKRFIYERAKQLGVQIVLVDKGPSLAKRMLNKFLRTLGFKAPDHWAQDLVSEFITVDTTDHEKALAAARKKLQRSARKSGDIDGIATFWEDDVPLTAELARALKLPYHTVDAADAVRSKLRTLEKLKEAGIPTGPFMRLTSAKDVDAAARTVGFPAVIKPEFGAAAMGVVRVNNAEELAEAYAKISPQLNADMDSIFVYGSDMVMMGYLAGREWDADVVMQDGKAVFTSVTDNWPTREPNFVATGSSLPSRTMSPKEQAEVSKLAEDTAKALGLRDGVVHIEGKYTKDGPRIIEANGRMGGVYVRDWVKTVWGVDLVDQQLLLAAGIPVGAYKPETPITHLEGEFIIHEEDGLLARQEMEGDALMHPGFHNFRQMEKPGYVVKTPFAARTGMLEAKGATAEEAQRNLNQLRAKLILDVKKPE